MSAWRKAEIGRSRTNTPPPSTGFYDPYLQTLSCAMRAMLPTASGLGATLAWRVRTSDYAGPGTAPIRTVRARRSSPPAPQYPPTRS